MKQMKRKKKVDYVMIILIIIFIIVAYCYMQLAVQKKEYVNFFGYTFFRVVSGSMADTIRINDIVIVEITKDVKKDDIITFKSENNFITHRVIEIEKQKIITQGDANNTPDDQIDIEDVLGKVVFIIPIEVSIKVFTSPEVLTAFAVSAVIIFIVFRKKKEESSKEEK